MWVLKVILEVEFNLPPLLLSSPEHPWDEQVLSSHTHTGFSSPLYVWFIEVLQLWKHSGLMYHMVCDVEQGACFQRPTGTRMRQLQSTWSWQWSERRLMSLPMKNRLEISPENSHLRWRRWWLFVEWWSSWSSKYTNHQHRSVPYWADVNTAMMKNRLEISPENPQLRWMSSIPHLSFSKPRRDGGVQSPSPAYPPPPRLPTQDGPEPCNKILRWAYLSKIQRFDIWAPRICSPGSLLQAPPLSGKLPPVAFQLFQDFELDGVFFVSCVPDYRQLEDLKTLIPDALLQHLQHWPL